jgi:hypothetical protein
VQHDIRLIFNEHAAKIDEKFTTQLVQDYRKTMDEKQKSKLSKFQGAVHRLYINGQIDHVEEVLTDMFNQLERTQMVCDSDEDKDQNKNSDS